MALLGFTAVTIRTRTAAWTNGVYTQGAWAESTIQGSIQPLTGREIEQMPEGELRNGRWKLYTQSDLQFANPATPQSTTEVSHEGRWLRAVVLSRWTLDASPLNNRKYVLLEPGQDPR